MRDRTKIIVNNREVSKRYLGNRLLWEEETLREIVLEEATIVIYDDFIVFRHVNLQREIGKKKIYKIKINDTQPFAINPNLFTVEFFSGATMYFNNINSQLLNEFKRRGVPANVRFDGTVTFYVK